MIDCYLSYHKFIYPRGHMTIFHLYFYFILFIYTYIFCNELFSTYFVPPRFFCENLEVSSVSSSHKKIRGPQNSFNSAKNNTPGSSNFFLIYDHFVTRNCTQEENARRPPIRVRRSVHLSEGDRTRSVFSWRRKVRQKFTQLNLSIVHSGHKILE